MANDESTDKPKSLAYVPVTDSTPDHASRFIADEVASWTPVIRSVGIALD